MKKAILLGFLASLAGTLLSTPVTGQISWTAEKSAVWKTETTIGEMLDSGDIRGALENFFDAFRAWGPDRPVRVVRAAWVKEMEYRRQDGMSLVAYSLEPLDIWVDGDDGDYGYVRYKASVTLKDSAGGTTVNRERCIDLMLKKDGRWLVAGSLTMVEDRGL